MAWLPENHEQLAGNHAKGAVGLFFVVGFLLVLFSEARFISIRTLLFFAVGLFATPLASALTYYAAIAIGRFAGRHLSLESVRWVGPSFWVLNSLYLIVVTWLLFHVFF